MNRTQSREQAFILLFEYSFNLNSPDEIIDSAQNIREEKIERLKKVWISSEVVMIDNVVITLDNLLYDIINYGRIIDNKVEIFKTLNLKDLEKTISSIDFNNASSVIVNPKKS